MRNRRSHKLIPLFDVTVSPETIRGVQECLRSGWLSTGPIVRRFEEEIGARLGSKHCVAVNSATSGLQLALMASNVTGREVITSPMTMAATIEAIILACGKPRFADIDAETLNLNPDAVLQRVTKNTAAILSVDFAGNPVDYRTLRAVARSRNIPLISDAAHSFAATVGNRSVATLADFIVFSFYATKNLTCAEGGMVVSRNKTNAQKIRRMSRHGMTTNAHDRKRQRGWNYDIPYLGLKANLSDVHAAIGLGMLRRFDTDQQKRRACAKRYSHNLSTLSEYLTLPQERPNTIHGWHLYVIRLNLDTLRITRDACIDHMRKRGVECGLHYRPITELSWYKKHVPFNQKQLSVLRRVAPTMMSLPLHPGLSAGDVDHVCKSLTDVVKRYRR